MFTNRELNVLHAALIQYKGIYPNKKPDELNENERAFHNDSLSIASDLADRFNELLQYYHEYPKIMNLANS